jgi:L-fuconolactonase
MRIDAHQHFWKFDPVRDNWITEEMSVIRKDFLPGDLAPVLKKNGFDGCVAVQADQSEKETEFLIGLSRQHDFIKGIVGWVDLVNENIGKRLSYYQQFSVVKGFRHILQAESDRAFMLRPEFMRGIQALKAFNYTYDILIYPDQLGYVKELIAAFPGQKFVIDHLAKPDIKNKMISDWKNRISGLGQYENVYCKISGLVTEADWKNWKQEEFIPYIDILVETFGNDRIIFGSDWPVCLLAGSYEEMLGIVKNYFSSFAQNEQEKFFGTNAVEFYNLK